MAKVFDNATDLITFARSSSGTALRRVGYGPELVVDGSGNWVGDFDVATDLNSWIVDPNGNGNAASVSGGQVTIDSTSGTGGTTLRTNVSLPANATYVISFTVVSASSNINVYNSGSGSQAAYGVGSHQITISNGGTILLDFKLSGTGQTAVLDNISVKEAIFDRATDHLVLFNHPDDTPRIEYGSDGSLKGLLIEGQRTNLVTYSEDFSNAAWQKSRSTAVLNAVGPDGVSNSAATLTVDTVGGVNTAYLGEDFTVSTSTSHTFSIFAKADQSSDIHVRIIGFTTPAEGGIYFDLSAGTVGTANAGLTGKIEDFGNGWRRCSVTFTTDATDTTGTIRIFLANGESLQITRDGTLSVLFYGAQLEEGSFPTAYIPTSGSQKTRSADVASIPVSAFGYNQQAGTVVVEATAPTGNTNNVNYASFGNADLNDFIRLWTWEGATSYVRWTGTNFDVTMPFVAGAAMTIAGSYAKDNYNLAVDGTAGSPDTAGAQTLDAHLLIIGSKTGATEHLNGHIKSIQYYPRRLTNAQLQELTS